MITVAKHTMMLLFTLLALFDGGQTWGDVTDGNAKIPAEYMHAARAIFPECATEDSDWCLWDASRQGNGRGDSFISVAGAVIIFD